jgi:DNA-binding NtrC family response regulator
MSGKILVVDDDPAARKLLVLLLQKDFQVLTASTGAEALRLIEAERPRLMLLDMVMPGMGGLDVLEALQPPASALTILVLTGENDIGLARRALELGAAEYITKPVDLALLMEKVTRCMVPAAKDELKAEGLPWRVVGGAPPS